jgi:hypothetical protein
VKAGRSFTALIIVSGLFCWLLLRPEKIAITEASGTPVTTTPHRNEGLAVTGKAESGNHAAPVQLLHGGAAIEFINDSTESSDTLAVQAIVPYLTHAEQAVRFAAKERLLQLGLAEAVEPLQSAAAKTTDPEEAAELRKAADFLALPSWSSQRAQPPVKPDAPSARLP